MKINAETIKNFRKKHRLTQTNLADILGVSYRTIQNYENGKPIPKSKLKLFQKVFETHDTAVSKVTDPDELLLKYKDFYAANPRFSGIGIAEIVQYVIVHDEELMKNDSFRLYIKNKQSEKAIEMLLKKVDGSSEGKLDAISHQNQTIIEYLEIQDIENTIKEAKAKAAKKIKKAKNA